MSKAVLISIRPEWAQKIMAGRKTIEVRRTRPKMDTPFKCYIYECGNGKVIGEFLCDQIININGAERIPSDAARPTCLEPAELHQYLGAATGFGWHISDLRVYDHPRDLWEFTGLRETKFGLAPEPITRQPAADVAEVVHGTPVTEVRTRTIVGYHEEIGVLAGDRSTLYRRNMVHVDIPYDYCPVCSATLCSRWHNFCGKCGAKMDGAAE